jgi:phenylacetate-CoA ligase
MVVVRGVNVYPSAIDQIVRSHPSILEYRVDVFTLQSLTELKVFIEPQVGVTQPEALAARLARDFQVSLALRVPVEVVESGSLPRFEMKARRWHRL